MKKSFMLTMQLSTMKPSLWPVVIAEENANDMFRITRMIRAISIAHPVIGFPTAQGAIDYFELALRMPSRFALPGMLFTDVHLPGGGGLSLINWIRRQRSLDSVQVYVISGSKNPDHPQQARDQGANGFLRKFPSKEALADLLQTPHSSSFLAALG